MTQLNYDEIRRIHRLEKNTSKLVELPDDFYSQLHGFLANEKKTYLDSIKDFSVDKSRDFTNLKHIVEEIFTLREKKILNKALISARTGEISDEHMATEEKKIFKKILALLEDHNSVLTSFFTSEPAKLEKDSAGITLKVLSEIPSFVGPNMKEYGPFSKDQVVNVPKKIAQLLESRKLAEIMAR